MHAILSGLPSHKLVDLAYQVASRLSTEQTPFQATLRMLLARLAADHPHHVLVFLLAQQGDGAKGTDKQRASHALMEVSGQVWGVR